MPSENNFNIVLYCLIAIVATFILLLTLSVFAAFLDGFSIELKRVNREIHRTHGHERKHWKRKRRKLWLSLLPFVRF